MASAAIQRTFYLQEYSLLDLFSSYGNEQMHRQRTVSVMTACLSTSIGLSTLKFSPLPPPFRNTRKS